MSEKSSIDDGLDLMLQESFSLTGLGKPPRELWRRILLMFRACKFLISIADETKKASLALSDVSSSRGSYHHIDGNSYTTEADGPPAPQLSIDIPSDANVKLQQDFIANIVKTKDLASLHEFGGVQGVAEALDTNLEKGRCGNVIVANTHSGTHSPAPGFIHLLLKSCNNYTIFLLLLSAVLSLGFGIKEEGLSTGWVEGAIIFNAVIILVFFPSIRDFWYGSSRRFLEKMEMMIDVLREGCQRKISKSHVSLGEIVCLKRGDQVPTDGLFISGELLISDDGLLSKVDDQNPFMFYGAKVIKGSGHMLVTSVGVKTVLGEMMNSITDDTKTPLQARLDRVNTSTRIFGLLTSLLIIIILFLRFKLEKEHDKGGIPEIKAPTSMKDIIDVTKRIVKKPSGKLSSLMTSLIMLLVGIVEGLPFLVILSITYWNRKILHGRAFAKELLPFVTIGSVTTICTDKSGGLTLNPQEVDSCWIGEEVIDADSVIASHVLEALCDGISTPVQLMDSPWTSQEDLLCTWIELRFGMDTELLKQSCTILKSTELVSREGGRGVLIRKGEMLEQCTCTGKDLQRPYCACVHSTMILKGN